MGYRDAVLADSPVSYWPLTETSGTTAVDAVAAHNGTYTGSYAQNAATVLVGTSVPSTNFTGGYVNLGDNAAYSPQAGASGLLTLECIWNPSTVSGTQMLMAKSDSGGSEYQFYASGSVLVIQIQQGNYVDICATSGGTLVAGANHHLVTTYDRAAGIVDLWINNVQVASSTAMTGTSADTATALNLSARVGLLNAAGLLAHCALYGSRLSAAKIASHFRESLRGGVSY